MTKVFQVRHSSQAQATLLVAFLGSAMPALASSKGAFMRVSHLKAAHSNRTEANNNPVMFTDPEGLCPPEIPVHIVLNYGPIAFQLSRIRIVEFPIIDSKGLAETGKTRDGFVIIAINEAYEIGPNDKVGLLANELTHAVHLSLFLKGTTMSGNEAAISEGLSDVASALVGKILPSENPDRRKLHSDLLNEFAKHGLVDGFKRIKDASAKRHDMKPEDLPFLTIDVEVPNIL